MGRAAGGTVFAVLGNQLFPPSHLRGHENARFFMNEDVGLCTYVRHHKQKIALFLAAMRSYADELRGRGFELSYHALDDDGRTYEQRMEAFVRECGATRVRMWEIEDRFFEARIRSACKAWGVDLEFLPSPMFVTDRSVGLEWLDGHRAHMADFYRWQRRRLGVLVDDEGQPRGGRWSYDDENRRALPKDEPVPEPPHARPTDRVREVIPLVHERFADHPGELSESSWWLPTTRRQTLGWVREFFERRFERFGPFEDALSSRGPVLFHSVLTPALNLGLVTPDELLERALEREHEVPLNSLEGFVRQIIGWREFVRLIDRKHGAEQEAGNHFRHARTLAPSWWDGTTGLPPLDGVIRKLQRFGWAHHIERLMIASNLMVLCEIEPGEAYRWFMEMFVDSSDWVMVPNVYGMGLFADGGVFATKPYICGSNYILKMSDETKPKFGTLFGSDEHLWTDVMDGLYWRFIERNREFFAGQARMAQAVRTLDRIDGGRRSRITRAAEAFLEEHTVS